MKIRDIANLPTLKDRMHESIFRAYHIVEKVKYLLQNNVPSNILLELIEEMENKNTDE